MSSQTTNEEVPRKCTARKVSRGIKEEDRSGHFSSGTVAAEPRLSRSLRNPPARKTLVHFHWGALDSRSSRVPAASYNNSQSRYQERRVIVSGNVGKCHARSSSFPLIIHYYSFLRSSISIDSFKIATILSSNSAHDTFMLGRPCSACYLVSIVVPWPSCASCFPPQSHWCLPGSSTCSQDRKPRQ